MTFVVDESTFKTCACEECQSYCRSAPGWMTTSEAKAAIAAGYATKLSREWNDPDNDSEQRVYFLTPAVVGHEASNAPTMEEMTRGMSIIEVIFSPIKKGTCTLLKDGLCTIHDSGFKPVECRAAHHEGVGYAIDRELFLNSWATDEGKQLVADWCKLVGLDPASPEE